MELAADGIPPHVAVDYTLRWIHVFLEGRALARTRDMQLAIFHAWQNQNLSRHKKLPNLPSLLRKLEPAREMSPKAIRSAIKNMAKAMGAEIRVVKKGQV